MTVDDLISKLQEFNKAGRGHYHVMVPTDFLDDGTIDDGKTITEIHVDVPSGIVVFE